MRGASDGLNWRESAIKDKYEADGWFVLRNGAPDFLLLRLDGDAIREVAAVEVKSATDPLTFEQGLYRRVCEHFGMKWIKEVVE